MGLSLSSATGLFLAGCLPARMGVQSSSNRSSAFTPVSSDHPLAKLQFRNSGMVSPSMHIGPVDTNVLFSEGMSDWHHKSSQPYDYLLPRSLVEADDMEIASLDPSRLNPPPLGIRSAPALGGFGTGTITLRADGSLADWHIFNNSPGNNAPKIHVPDAFWGIRTKTSGGIAQARAIRTHPPEDLPAIQSITGSGGFPATVLSIADPNLLLATQMYAYGTFDLHHTKSSAVPAVLFSILMSNPTPYPVSTSLMFALPNVIEGTFRTENGLILSRSGDTPMAGEICMSFITGAPSYSMVSADLSDIWDTFDKSGTFQQANALGILEYGAISTGFVLEPRASRTTSFILSWHFPNRDIGSESVGNFYTTKYASTREVNQHLERNLPDLWSSMQRWQQLCLDNSLPASVQDALLNSISLLYKNTFATSDGRWRHWDSFANPGISSLDQQLYRAFPLLFFAPDVLKNQLRAFATHQHSNGQILSSLGMGNRHPLDRPDKPIYTTHTPALFILVYLYFCYTDDRDFLQDIWPHIDKAIDWQLSITTPEGLPSNLPQLGDWEALNTEGINLSDALLHLAGLSAAIQMAQKLDLEATIKKLQPVVVAGVKGLDSLFWNEDHYRSYTSDDNSTEYSSDGLIGFLLPLLAGIQTAAPERIAQHLKHVKSDNLSRHPAQLMHWAALHILTNETPRTGLDTVSKHISKQRDELHDLWGYYEQLTAEGQPWANPNHTSHLSIWFVLLALTGQRFEATNRRLYFSPRMSVNARLPSSPLMRTGCSPYSAKTSTPLR